MVTFVQQQFKSIKLNTYIDNNVDCWTSIK